MIQFKRHLTLRTLGFWIIVVGLLCFSNLGCTRLFFYPMEADFPYLKEENVQHERLSLQSADGTRLSAMRLATKVKPQGVALQFHGNAQNMTSHYRFLTWLTEENWEVLTFDYRGYGKSQGQVGSLRSNFDGLIDDGVTAIGWANQRAKDLKVPLVIFGQSLGGNLSLRSLVTTQADHLRLMVVDSSFYSFHSIAREKLSDMWLTWPFQWIVYFLISDYLSAGPAISAPLNVPLPPAVFLHSESDPVVSVQQGRLLYEAYPSQKMRFTTPDPGHMNAMSDMKVREQLRQVLRALKL